MVKKKIIKAKPKVEKKRKPSLEKQLEELSKHPILQGDGLHTCSNGVVVNIRAFEHNIRKKMMGMDNDEIMQVLELTSEYRKVFGSWNVLNIAVRNKSRLGPLKGHRGHWNQALERSQELLDLFGKMYSGAEVHKIVTTEWELETVKYDEILKFQRANADVIAKLRDDYSGDIKSLRLTHKKSRLDELSTLYGSRKQKYYDTKAKSDYKLMLKTFICI